jgi:prepilin-type processing-associated H-X9-DG protein
VHDGIRGGICISIPQAPCTGSFTFHGDKQITMSARSMHPGGVNVLMGDGSIHFVADEIDLAVWRAAGTMQALPNEPNFAGF